MSKYHVGHPTEIHVYKNDVRVKHFTGSYQKGNNGGRKEKITEWSWKSRRELAFVASNTDVEFDVMVTLTYPREYPADGSVCKRHLDRFLTWMRRRVKPMSYLWFFEFQKRGAPHYHLMYKSLGVKVPKTELSQAWYSIVESGDESHLAAGTRIEKIRSQGGASRYAVKYAMKMYQKHVPSGFERVGRFWGTSRDVPPAVRAKVKVKGEVGLKEAVGDWSRWKDEAVNWSTLYGASEHVDIERLTRNGA